MSDEAPTPPMPEQHQEVPGTTACIAGLRRRARRGYPRRQSGRGASFPLADVLIDRGIPLVFTTGYDASALPQCFAHVSRCDKSINMERITAALRKAIHS